MINLKYTDEMKKQDKLWETEEEDTKIMQLLYMQIIEEFSEHIQGFVFDTYEMNGECVIDVFESIEKKETVYNSDDEIIQFGFCRSLIDYLEIILNQKDGE